jgi:hypothetical protein
MEIEIFATGTKRDSAGKLHTITDADLQRRAELYNSQNGDTMRVAPLAHGRPSQEAPAFGWVRKLRASGGKLFAELYQVSEKFANSFKRGSARINSAAFYDSGLLRFISFKSSDIDATDGAGMAFSDCGDTYATFTFSEGLNGSFEIVIDETLRASQVPSKYLDGHNPESLQKKADAYNSHIRNGGRPAMLKDSATHWTFAEITALRADGDKLLATVRNNDGHLKQSDVKELDFFSQYSDKILQTVTFKKGTRSGAFSQSQTFGVWPEISKRYLKA